MFDMKAAIFDMDGTIIDSMWVWKKIDIKYLQKRNIEVPLDLKECIEDKGFSQVAQYFKDRFGITDSIEKIQDEWNNMAFYEYSHNVYMKKGVKEYINKLKSLGIKIGLATSNCQLLIDAALKSNKIDNLFDSITISDEVTRGKNFPDIYLLAAKKLGVSPKECVVFEDILPAVKGAKAAGMRVVAVHDADSECYRDEMTSLSDLYIYEYESFLDAV
jgi:HAD superfamily hydrolase (TIGR01509 family)